MSPRRWAPNQPEHIERSPEVPLVGLLAEFRTRSVRRSRPLGRAPSAAGAVALVQGRRIGQLGSAYQYLFQVENALNLRDLPGGTPGDLMVGSGRRHEATVIAVEGIEHHQCELRPRRVRARGARLVSNLAHLMRKLIERIESLRDVPDQPGERILGNEYTSGEPERDRGSRAEPSPARRSNPHLVATPRSYGDHPVQARPRRSAP